MESIKTYSDTKNELKIVQARIRLLNDKKSELMYKYCGVHSISFDKEGGGGTPSNNSPVVAYLEAVETRKQENGLSIQEELENLAEREKTLSSVISDMESALYLLKGLEYKIYYQIIVKGKEINEAIEYVAQENYISERTAWRYYKNVKKYLIRM